MNYRQSFVAVASPYLTYHVVIHGKDLPVNIPYEVAVKLDWGTVVRTAMNHYADHEPVRGDINQFAGVKIVGVWDMQYRLLIPVEHRIPTTARNLLNISNPRYGALLLGPVHMLPDKLLQKSFSEYLYTVKDLSTLCRVSKDFRRLFMSDFLWKDIDYPYTDWLGFGRDGAEELVWRLVRAQQGLTTFGSYRYLLQHYSLKHFSHFLYKYYHCIFAMLFLD
ncbi:F-box protein [archaeon]|nr:MAG: F-box protein [archaeon]